MTDTLTAALDYAGHGLRVLPIMPGGKRPPMAEWQNAATTDPEIITSWWTGLYAGYGLGIATGRASGIFVLDVDVSDGKAGDETLRELEIANDWLPATVSVITGSGGCHYYFRFPADFEVRNDAGKRLGPGLDIRGEGGQVVAPPTVHPITGRTYEWEDGCGLGEIPIADAPDWLLALLRPVVPDITPHVMRTEASGEDDGPAKRYNDRTNWVDLLSADGWTLSHTDRSGCQHWTRPGKDPKDGTSATVGYEGRDILRVFTSSIAGLDEGAYSRFGYTAAMRHHGDRSAFATELLRGEMGPVDRWVDSVPMIGSTPTTELPDPIPLGSPYRSGPEFPLDCLPDWIADQCREVAHAFQVPVDLPAMLAIGALSTISTGRVRVNLTGSAWSEHLNLYLVSAMAPGTGKSPVFKVMTKPIGEIERQSMEHARQIGREAQADRQVAERKLAEASRDTTDKAKTKIADALKDLDKVPTPPAGRLVVEDITPEALVEELAANAGRLAIMSSEGGVFDMMAGQYSERGKATNLAIYLQGWSGDPVRRKRTKGEESRIDEALLSVCVTTQPGVVASLGGNRELVTKGVPVRFMFSVPPSLVGYRDRSRVFTMMSPEVAETYTETMQCIGRRLLANQHPTVVQLTADAAEAFVDWDQHLEQRLRPGGDLADRAEWAAKLRASVLRMAGLLHVADIAAIGERSPFGEIGIATIARAIEIGGYWLDHADVVERMWSEDHVIAKARSVVAWAIEQGGEFSLRDLFVAKRGSFPTADDTVDPMQLLVDRHWIVALQDGPVRVSGRGVPSQRFIVRPDASNWIATIDAQPAQLIHSDDTESVKNGEGWGKVARVEMVARKSGNKNYLPISPSEPPCESHAQPAQPAQLPTGTEAALFRPF